MKDRANFLSLIAGVAVLIAGEVAIRVTRLFSDYGERVIDPRENLLLQFGISFFFGLLILVYFQLVFIRFDPARWVFAVHLALALLIISPYVFTYLLPLGFLRLIPLEIRNSLTFIPRSYTGISGAILFWSGIYGLILRGKGAPLK